MAYGTMQERLRAFCSRWWLPLIGFVAGLAIGPLLTGYLGIQVTTDTLRHTVHDAIVSEQAAMCEMLARASTDGTTQLDAEKRTALATKYAHFPWSPTPDREVVSRCSTDLAKHPTSPEKHQGSA